MEVTHLKWNVMPSKQDQIAALVFDYLQDSFNSDSKGIPISIADSYSDSPSLLDWARSNNGLPTELKPKSKSEKNRNSSLRRSLSRALEILMEQYPGAIGFTIPESTKPDHFYTLKPGCSYKSEFNNLSKKAKYYSVKGDVAISSLNMAFAELMQKTMGKEDFGFLEDTVAYTLSYSTDELNQAEGQFHKNWLSKIEITPRYQSLYPPKPGADAEEICKALFLECSFKASYLNGKATTYWPVRLVRQERVLYVVCKTEEEGFYEEYALHRFSGISIDYDDEAENKVTMQRPDWISYDAEEINENRKPPIVLDGHQNISTLTLEFFGQPAQHMSEVHFHPVKQERIYPTKFEILTPKKPGERAEHSRITAYNIPYNYNFLTWLLGFGSQVKVIYPVWLKDVVTEQLRQSLERY